MSETPLQSGEGWIADELRAEHPGLGLVTLTLSLTTPLPRRTSRGLRERLDRIAERIHGAEAVTLRQQPVPHAYRVFFRHIGLDPDVTRIPVEALYVERLWHGGMPKHGPLGDALQLALAETNVPVWALDTDTLDGALGLRLTRAGERLGRDPDTTTTLPSGRIVVADQGGPLALIFGDPAAPHGATREAMTITLFTIRVDGVGMMEIEEALWISAEALQDGG